MNDQIQREQNVHGRRWNEVHSGYYSDPAAAAPLVRKIIGLAGKTKPDVILDLGGGNAFLLSRIGKAGIAPEVSLVNLDDSSIQLDAAQEAGFPCIRGSVDTFQRQDIGTEDKRFFWIMRSVLHYFGIEGLRPVLRHLRAQARPGEYFVHQTASFKSQEDADCMNALYGMMGTPKWYPAVDFLCECLQKEGWRVLEVLPAQPARLTSDDLMHRYQLDRTDIQRIRGSLSGRSSMPDDVFQKTEDGFRALLHYWIYVCTAAKPGHRKRL